MTPTEVQRLELILRDVSNDVASLLKLREEDAKLHAIEAKERAAADAATASAIAVIDNKADATATDLSNSKQWFKGAAWAFGLMWVIALAVITVALMYHSHK